MNARTGIGVEARAVSRVFRGRGGEEVHAVRGVSLVLSPGEFVALRGRSGSGKTTLLCLLGGLDRPSSGTILADGKDLARMSRAERARLAVATGFVLQAGGMPGRLPVWENVSVGLVPLGIPSRERFAAAEAELELVGLLRLARRRTDRLSTGEGQRLALARSLVLKPRLLVADEPTSNLDPASAAIVSERIAAARDEGATVIAVTHDPALVSLAARVLTMDGGSLTGD